MNLIQSWKDSLSVLQPKNLKLFLLVTAKTIKETYIGAVKYFWWFIALYAAIRLTISLPEKAHLIILNLLSIFWTFILVLSARASVAKKDTAYFVQYSKYLPAVIGGQLLITTIVGIANIPLIYVVSLVNTAILFSYAFILSIVLESSFMLFYFFELDMPLTLKNWVKSIRFAFRMLFYNLPLYFIFVGGLFLIFVLVEWSIGRLCTFIPTDCASFLDTFKLVRQPILVALISNLYIKRLHEQPQLYFKEPKEE